MWLSDAANILKGADTPKDQNVGQNPWKKAYQKGSVVGNSKPKPPSKRQPTINSLRIVCTWKQAKKNRHHQALQPEVKVKIGTRMPFTSYILVCHSCLGF